MNNPKAQAKQAKRAKPVVDENLVQAAEHMHTVAKYQAEQLGIMYPPNVQWTFNLRGESDSATVKLLSMEGLAAGSELRALAIVTVPWSAWDAGYVKAADALINYRIQDGLYKLQCALIDAGTGDAASKTVSKQELKVAIGFEPSDAQKKNTKEGSDKRQLLFTACEAHRATIADKALANIGRPNPIGDIARAPSDPAQLTVSPAFECPKGCYAEKKAFSSERLPNVKNIPFYNEKTGKFCDKAIKATAKSPRLKCQHCGAQAEFIKGGTERVIKDAQAKLAKLMRRVNGEKPEAPKGSANKVQRFEARQEVALQTAKHYGSKA
jgi:hypothetical protein